MLIGLISDTHVPEAGRELWPQVYDAFLGVNPEQPKVDIILHAGDMHDVRVLDWLEDRVGVPVYGCRGNGDDGGGGRTYQPDHPRLKADQVLDIEGFRIGLTHDFALPEWPPYRTIDKMMERYFGGPVQIVVHGHTATSQVIFTEYRQEKAGDPMKFTTQGKEYATWVKVKGQWLYKTRQIASGSNPPEGWKE